MCSLCFSSSRCYTNIGDTNINNNSNDNNNMILALSCFQGIINSVEPTALRQTTKLELVDHCSEHSRVPDPVNPSALPLWCVWGGFSFLPFMTFNGLFLSFYLV